MTRYQRSGADLQDKTAKRQHGDKENQEGAAETERVAGGGERGREPETLERIEEREEACALE